MRKQLLTVLNYFAYFSYAPSFWELYVFFPTKIDRKRLQIFLDEEVKLKKIVKLSKNYDFRLSNQPFFGLNFEPEFPKYTLPQYSIKINKKLKYKNLNSDFWTVKTVQVYLHILKHFSSVLFVGITGKSAMKGFQKNDDLDLFFITKKNMLWTTRFFVVFFAKILRIHTSTGVCLNLFFDESDVCISKQKQNSYIAHEILQMRPIINKTDMYQKFLTKNKWIYQYFPNAKSRFKCNFNIVRSSYSVYKNIDHIFKLIQLPIIIRNNTALSISDTQLWLFKKDFEKKLKRRGLVI